MITRHNLRMGKSIAIGLWLLTVGILLSACGSSDADSAAPVEPDPGRPTFIMFFTDP
jgi:hypothetical protein